ncbi:DUF2845 domain-containing protein [Ramlibacter ginsenosidimutans]|uniref:DUF2845 domain-containing protein n=1 Tax=Ramlibacter ginsenosidimutans TaxID=502333 RepID=A0A934U295_9BURK|nr:DUF2845 domain-containing protein [Ramlibacter ginsenosidimutans]MBK6009502.1 DUF2845 domain-containing protein [Ramlibacter ginsenosidimutans]
MPALLRFALIVALLALGRVAHAENLRCNGAIASEGDSKVSVLYKCGQPLLMDSFCAPVYLWGTPQPIPAPAVPLGVPCQTVEEWLYDRGPGNLIVIVRFRDGRVQSIRYSAQPQ